MSVSGGDVTVPAPKGLDLSHAKPVVDRVLALLGDGTRPSCPLVIGVSAAQGAGKTTLTNWLVAELASQGVRAVAVSIDDFYLTHAEQLEVKARHPGNRLFEQRGAPGTHDVALGVATIRALMTHPRSTGAVGGDSSQCTLVPRYEKSLFSGRGDRLPREQWTAVNGALDVILFEGWCLGFRPVSGEQAPSETPDPAGQMVPVDAYLAGFEAWHKLLDLLVVIEVPDIEWIVAWRLESERRLREAKGTGMTEEETHDYISRFACMHRAYFPALYSSPFPYCSALHFVANRDRTFAIKS
eukprot:m.33730 g.33730  ORF g.33730 m.33730 type:complete len:298 (+) comp10495_c0_seq2:97-990(+)